MEKREWWTLSTTSFAVFLITLTILSRYRIFSQELSLGGDWRIFVFLVGLVIVCLLVGYTNMKLCARRTRRAFKKEMVFICQKRSDRYQARLARISHRAGVLREKMEKEKSEDRLEKIEDILFKEDEKFKKTFQALNNFRDIVVKYLPELNE